MYNLFISHSWSYSDNYEGLIKLLDSAPYFSYKDYSVPRYNPIHSASNQQQLREAIKAQMAPASCILVLAGVYSTDSKWINIEIDLAKNGFYTPKKIIAIEPWASEKTSTTVKNAADVIVKWQTSSIISAIRS
jgi:hypothetical protein